MLSLKYWSVLAAFAPLVQVTVNANYMVILR